MTYIDVLHIYGITRAGYIPQLFSLRLPNPDIIYELLDKAGAKALVYDPSYAATVAQCPIPAHAAISITEDDVCDAPVPPIPMVDSCEDTVMIFHTSGSTSGSPKLVPCNYTWLEAMLSKAYQTTIPRDAARQDVTGWL